MAFYEACNDEGARCVDGVAVPVEFLRGRIPKRFHIVEIDGVWPVDEEAFGTEEVGAHAWEEMFHHQQ